MAFDNNQRKITQGEDDIINDDDDDILTTFFLKNVFFSCVVMLIIHTHRLLFRVQIHQKKIIKINFNELKSLICLKNDTYYLHTSVALVTIRNVLLSYLLAV